MAKPPRKLATYEDYLAVERQTGLRHEFIDGEIIAMPGGTIRHSALKTNLTTFVNVATLGGPCRSFDSDLKLHNELTDTFSYADLTVLCGEIRRSPQDRNAITNPTALCEVLSPSTEKKDRGERFFRAQQLPSLRHYVLLSTERELVEVYTRTEQGWLYRSLGRGDILALFAIGVEIPIDQLYDNLPEEPPGEAPAEDRAE